MGALLEIADLRRSFGGVRALDGVRVAIEAGRLTGLIGPNGAGKTTLFHVVSGLLQPEAGRVVFDGQDITGWKPERVTARGLVRSFQIARGFPKLTVFDHLMIYGTAQPGESLWRAIIGGEDMRRRERALAEQAWEIARRLNLIAVIDHPVTRISGGQKKLLEIGRALMARPKLILLDEPVAGVNPVLAEEIADHLKSLVAEGITILLIEHDMALIERVCEQVVVMAQGKDLATGRFDEVRENSAVQDAYLGGRR
jgi:ABC-type branched-subunit amino acid transport system ATPase component